jgi:kinesin family member 5
VSDLSCVIQQGTFSERDERHRQILAKLDNIDPLRSLTAEDLTTVRRQLSEGQSLVRETVDRLNGVMTRRRDELEAQVAALETEYEKLLGEFICLKFETHLSQTDIPGMHTEKTIDDEETSNVDLSRISRFFLLV